MKSCFIFGGESSLDYNLTIESYPSYNTAQRAIEKYQVPGRSGSLVFDTGAFENVMQSYAAYLKAFPLKTHQAARSAANWLMAPGGYKRLEDSYDPEVYRMAVFSGPLDLENWFAKYGRATLEFDCMPQRWLKSGEMESAVQNGGHIYNPGQESQPLIRISGTGAGTLILGKYNIQISSIPAAGLWMDSETQNAYSGTTNENDQITLTAGFPMLPPGETEIGWSGGITGVWITPRWWML